jgi:plastocyanin
MKGVPTVCRSFTVIKPITPGCLIVAAAAWGGAQAAEVRATVRDEQGRAVRDAVVIAVPETPVARPSRPKPEQIEQIDLEFVPGVKAIQAGTAVSFPNRDKVRHHVYSFSPPKRFDLPLYAGTPEQPVLFDTPGVVTIGCNIHDWMVGYIYVAESPYFAVTAADGTALLAGLPDGRYRVRVWHAQLGSSEEATRRQAELGAAQNAALDWRIPLKPELRVRRRGPASGQGGRY